jgi:hypothetical protein
MLKQAISLIVDFERNGDISTVDCFAQGTLGGRPKLVRSAQPGVLP